MEHSVCLRALDQVIVSRLHSNLPKIDLIRSMSACPVSIVEISVSRLPVTRPRRASLLSRARYIRQSQQCGATPDCSPAAVAPSEMKYAECDESP
jgi:hypothetical protein